MTSNAVASSAHCDNTGPIAKTDEKKKSLSYVHQGQMQQAFRKKNLNKKVEDPKQRLILSMSLKSALDSHGCLKN